jgi:hypothetical protein
LRVGMHSISGGHRCCSSTINGIAYPSPSRGFLNLAALFIRQRRPNAGGQLTQSPRWRQKQNRVEAQAQGRGQYED